MYSKLFSSILTSSIWSEDAPTCKVWVTLLALQNREGCVYGGIPGLARIAGLPIPEVASAIAKFLAPDPHSSDLERAPERLGKRLEAIDGGWRLLNAEHYRDLKDDDERRRQDAERKRRSRESAASRDVTVGHGESAKSQNVPPSESESDTDTDKKPICAKKDPPTPQGPSFAEFWAAFPSYGRGKADAAKAWGRLTLKERAKAVPAAKEYALEVAGRAKQHVKMASGWLSGKRFDDAQEPLLVAPPPVPQTSQEPETWPAWVRHVDDQVRAQRPIPGEWVSAALEWRRGRPQECPEDLAALAPWEKE